MATIKQVAQAFVAGREAQCHNAVIDGQEYRLHGNLIALKCTDGVSFNWRGWYTPTTANHINHILDAMGAGVRASYAQDREAGVKQFYVPNRRG